MVSWFWRTALAETTATAVQPVRPAEGAQELPAAVVPGEPD